MAPVKDNSGKIISVIGVDIVDEYLNSLLLSHKLVQIGVISLIIIVYFLLLLILFKNFQVLLLYKEKESDSHKIDEKIQEATKLRDEAERKTIELDNTKKAILNVLEDVQEEKNKFAAVSNRLKLATDSAKIGVWEWDLGDNIITWDEQMFRLYGCANNNCKNAFDIREKGIHPDDKKLRDDAFNSAIKNNKNIDVTIRSVWPNGEIKYLKIYGTTESDNGKVNKLIGVDFDITHEKEVDQEKTEFVSLASHQLKTPVGSINWNLEMLRDGDYGKLTIKQKEVISEMYTMSKRMNDLINSLLNVSRIELGVFIIEPTPTDWCKLCDEVLLELKPKLENKKHKLTIKYDDKAKNIPADPKLLRIIFQNYISNAIKYTPDNGMVDINIICNDKEVLFSVTNNGDPVPDNDKDKIFSKMFRASNAQVQDPDGNGLGLYIVRKITENGGGKAWFESGKGKSTTFFISFPISGMIKKEGQKALS